MTEDSQLAALGRSAREQLRYAWDQEPRDSQLVQGALRAVRATFGSDPEASEALLRRALEPEHLASHGHEELIWFLSDADQIASESPAFLRDSYAAVFDFAETSEDTTQMYPSRLMGLSSTRRQDYQMARYELGQALPSFLELAPEYAIEAALSVARSHAEVENQELVGRSVRFRLAHRQLAVSEDHSHIWDSSASRGPEEETFDHFQAYLEKVAAGGPQNWSTLVGALAADPFPAVVLSRILAAAANSPEAFLHPFAELLTKSALLAMVNLRLQIGHFLRAAFPLLANDERVRVERALIDSPRHWPKDTRDYGRHARDVYLSLLRPVDLVEAWTRHRRAELADEGEPELRPPFSFEMGWRGSVSTEEQLREQGANPALVANEKLLSAVQPLEAFRKAHENGIAASDEIKHMLRPLKRLYSALERGDYAQAEEPVDAHARVALASAAEVFSRAPSALTEAQGRWVRKVLLTAARDPRPSRRSRERIESFDSSPAWGPAPRIDAASGLCQLMREARYVDRETLAAVTALAHDDARCVRFQAARRLGALARTAPQPAWEIAEAIGRREKSASVLSALAHAIGSLTVHDPTRGMSLAQRILSRENRRKEPRENVRNVMVDLLIGHHVWQGSDSGSRLANRLAREPASSHAVISHVLHDLRDSLFHGEVDVADPRRDRIRTRGLEVVRTFLTAARTGVDDLRRRNAARSGPWSEEDALELEGCLAIAHAVGDQLYFSSGVFQERHPGNDRHADLQQRERLYHEANDLLKDLASVGHAPTTHHLIEMLEGCIDFDPPGVFLLIATAVRSGREWGYQYESLAQNLVVRVVQRYLTDHREVVQSSAEAEKGLVDVLDVFVEAGWPEARQLIFGLEDVFR
jgi:hypothetical protein